MPWYVALIVGVVLGGVAVFVIGAVWFIRNGPFRHM